MKVTTKGRYALRVMIDLAENDNGAPIPLRSIGERQAITVKYLEQIVALLSAAGLVTGSRGNGGGYRLAVKPSELTVGRILHAAEGENTAALPEDINPKAAAFWQGLEKAVTDYIEGQTLEDVVKNSRTSSRRDPSIWIL